MFLACHLGVVTVCVVIETNCPGKNLKGRTSLKVSGLLMK